MIRAGFIEQAKKQAVRACEQNFRDRITSVEDKIRELEKRILVLEGGDLDVEMD